MQIPKWLSIVGFLAALVGFADSAYLTAQHVRGILPPCGLASQCDVVLTSAYSAIGPIPVAALGVLYYGAILVLLIAAVDSGARRPLQLATWIIRIGMLSTVYLIILQAFVLHAWCLYCLTSAAMTILLFLCSLRIARIQSY